MIKKILLIIILLMFISACGNIPMKGKKEVQVPGLSAILDIKPIHQDSKGSYIQAEENTDIGLIINKLGEQESGQVCISDDKSSSVGGIDGWACEQFNFGFDEKTTEVYPASVNFNEKVEKVKFVYIISWEDKTVFNTNICLESEKNIFCPGKISFKGEHSNSPIKISNIRQFYDTNREGFIESVTLFFDITTPESQNTKLIKPEDVLERDAQKYKKLFDTLEASIESGSTNFNCKNTEDLNTKKYTIECKSPLGIAEEGYVEELKIELRYGLRIESESGDIRIKNDIK